MSAIHQAIERRTGWLFGTYRGMRKKITDPLASIGRTATASGGDAYPSGVYVTFGDRGVYICRSDGLERGRNRELEQIEVFANGGSL